MSSEQDGFENALQELIEAGDWDGWLLTRSLYADWLEEQNHPLQFWARAKVWRRVHHQSQQKNGHFPELSWHMEFAVNMEAQKSPGSWFMGSVLDWKEGAARLSMNYHRTLGFPATQLRYTRRGVHRNLIAFHRFTFRPKGPRVSAERMAKLAPDCTTAERRKAGIYQAFDTTIHPLGYAALFLPHWYRQSGQAVQGTLFEVENLEGAKT